MKDTKYSIDEMFESWEGMSSRIDQSVSSHPVTKPYWDGRQQGLSGITVRKWVYGISLAISIMVLAAVLLLHPRPLNCWQGIVPIAAIGVLSACVSTTSVLGLNHAVGSGRKVYTLAVSIRTVRYYVLLLLLSCGLLFTLRPADSYNMSTFNPQLRAACLTTVDDILEEL